MAKHYACINCGYESLNWLGKCPNCGSWNSLEEVQVEKLKYSKKQTNSGSYFIKENAKEILKSQTVIERMSSGITEFDRVLSSGFVDSQVCLLGGEPGVGKSTLLLQVCFSLASKGFKTVYISAEESLQQVKSRIGRIHDVSKLGDKFNLICTQDLNRALDALGEIKPRFVVFDSIQTLYNQEGLVSGGIAQVRNTAIEIIRFCKSQGIASVMVGHINKEGEIAGPIVLEHLVDTVLFLEGDMLLDLRLLKVKKNRFGKIGEIGVFEINETGLKVITNSSNIFLIDRKIAVSGVANSIVFEGSRAFPIEIQALVDKSNFTSPRRVTKGIQLSKLQVILAILNKHTKYNFQNLDVIVNLPGGLNTTDEGIDLGIATALISSLNNKPVGLDSVFLGELSLTGELMVSTKLENRVKEALARGFKRVYLPTKGNVSVSNKPSTKLIKVDHIKDIFSKKST